jgi:hypothetical protein
MSQDGSPAQPSASPHTCRRLNAATPKPARLAGPSGGQHPKHPVCAWRVRLVLAAAACLAGITPAGAQDDVQLWTSANTSGAVHRVYRVSAELHARWVDDASKLQRTILRLQAGRALSKELTAWFGFEETRPIAHRTAEETRIWQQVIFVQPAGAWALSHRARLEERFIEFSDGMVPRFRYSLRATRPMVPKSPWGYVLGTEIFYQLRTAYLKGHRFPTGLDRDRLQAGISRRLTKRVSLEPSYLLQFINDPQPLPNRREHLIQLQLTHRF